MGWEIIGFGIHNAGGGVTDDDYKTMRRPVLEKAGIDRRAIDYLLSLERGTVDAAVTTLKELTQTPAWPGREAILPGGTKLRFESGRWILAI